MTNTADCESNIRADILEAIRKAWPRDVVEMLAHFAYDDGEEQQCYLAEVFDELRRGLASIKGASLMYERAADGTSPQHQTQRHPSLWDDDDDLPMDDGEPDASYHLFFLGLRAPEAQFETESQEPVDYDDEDAEMKLVNGTGSVGCAVAVSLVAPLALIVPDSIEQYDSGTHTCPSIDPHIFHIDGGPMDMDDFIRNEHSHEAYDLICELRNEITGVLESLGISVLAKDEAEKPAPWLKAGEGAWIGQDGCGDEIRVRHAFFFRGIY